MRTGKTCRVSAKRILQGPGAHEVTKTDTLEDATALDDIIDFARKRGAN